MLVRLNRSAAILVIVTAVLLGNLAQAEDLFPDKVLEAAVRQQVFEKRDNDEPLTEDDVKDIAVITYKGHTYSLDGKKVQRDKIKDLSGLEKCRSLRQLDLEDHEITDLSPLKDLELIQSLILSHNKIQDIKPLAGLTKLQHLELEYNEVTDISPLAKLENMRSLYLSNNKIANIKPIAGLQKLWSLYLDNNRVTDLAPISKMRFLDTIGLSGNQIEDLAPLASLNPSNFLFLENNRLKDISVLVNMAKKDREGEMRFAPFWKVYLSGNPLEGGSDSKQLAELRRYSLASRIHFD